jgi:hypothetical protein
MDDQSEMTTTANLSNLISPKITSKVWQRLFNPQGAEVWKRPALAAGIKVTILNAIEDYDEILVTEDDVLLIATVAIVLRVGTAYDPFGGSFTGQKMCQTPATIERALS